MKTYSFNVIPDLPENLKPLNELATNMWFTWNWDAIMMFVQIDEEKWHISHRNPKWILGTLSHNRIEQLSKDENFLKLLNNVKKKYDDYMSVTDTWFNKNKTDAERNMLVAYFSMEYGIGEGLPIYSGGLGMLSGDHLKSSSDMGLPVIGMGLLYRKGYVQQVLNRDNWQTEAYPENDWYNMPVEIVKRTDGSPIRVSVNLAGEEVKVGIWRVPVGRTSLYLLDTNLTENSISARGITEQLYGGDRENRIRQEIILGIGGYRALKEMGLLPTIYHVNEGHSAFLLLERIRDLMKEKGLNFYEAKKAVWATSVFTTHTPVMAGNEYFDFNLIKKYFENYSAELGISFADFLELGKEEKNSLGFCMTVLALRLAAYSNAVSKLHQDTSRKMWHKVWSNLPLYDIPIDFVTNGVHTSSWISHEHHEEYCRYVFDNANDTSIVENYNWNNIHNIPDEKLWELKMIRKNKLIKLIRDRMIRQYKRLGADSTVIKDIQNILNPEYLTIGFARRFATYKRANLFMKNLERLAEIVNNDKMPVQFIISGKAHQADTQGKELIKQVASLNLDKRFKSRIVFVEDYNMNVARYMIQGVDVWLNNPIRSLEASGTSGMKAAINGVLNLSVLDGWWDEGYSPELGWAIGGVDTYKSDDERDYVESESLYNLLEKVVVPLYYDKENGLPRKWIKMMKNSVSRLVPYFNTDRMLREYYQKFYVKANDHFNHLINHNVIKESVGLWWNRVYKNFDKIRVVVDNFKPSSELKTGNSFEVRAVVWLGDILPDDVKVEIVIGSLDGESIFKYGRAFEMKCVNKGSNGYIYSTEIKCYKSGKHDFAVRVLPYHKELPDLPIPGFIVWNE
ncbi:MAG: alpha-glucan family phosphorylase [Elusimicrobiales bacterium]|nr:alpha-glucan family phosphorylase [Elusimicrobiales bacterium]